MVAYVVSCNLKDAENSCLSHTVFGRLCVNKLEAHQAIVDFCNDRGYKSPIISGYQATTVADDTSYIDFYIWRVESDNN